MRKDSDCKLFHKHPACFTANAAELHFKVIITGTEGKTKIYLKSENEKQNAAGCGSLKLFPIITNPAFFCIDTAPGECYNRLSIDFLR
ncbi:MAG TPA: hypothetical protein DCY17_00435 [Clostridiales bacterium]|nr:hypothetical protein [Clostridiales bacterium]